MLLRVPSEKVFDQAICRTKEQKARLQCLASAGLALSRLDQLLPIGSRAKRGPRATPANQHKLTLCSEAAYVTPARGLHAVFLKREITCHRSEFRGFNTLSSEFVLWNRNSGLSFDDVWSSFFSSI